MAWMPLVSLGHESVMVFFVMSGFIIYSHTVGSKLTARRYAVARASRIYSVAVPATAASLAASAMVLAYAPALTTALPTLRAFSWADLAGTLAFVNESWWSSTELSLNAPYWSLCYEVWYYVLFGLFVFTRGWARAALVLSASLIAGPAIVVLFPIWCMGAWLASRLPKLPRPEPYVACAAIAGTFAAVLGIDKSGVDVSLQHWIFLHLPGYWRLEASQQLVTDHIIGACVVANIYAFTGLPKWIHAFFVRARPVLAYFAGFSFTLYLLHRPITLLAGQLVPASYRLNPWVSLWVASAVLTLCWLASWITERQLPRWRSTLTKLLPDVPRRGSKTEIAS